jgi:Carboxypeptidase regulatory-like domain
MRRHPVIDETVPAPAPAEPSTRWLSWKRVTGGASLSRVQSIVATVTGIISIAGAVFSISPFAHASTTGELVATVQEAGSHRSVRDATVEVLTTQNEIVATLTPDANGRAMQDLKEGVYVVRVSHPRYAAEVRRVQVFSHQTVELRTTLRAGSSSPLDRAVNNGVRAVRKALHF